MRAGRRRWLAGSVFRRCQVSLSRPRSVLAVYLRRSSTGREIQYTAPSFLMIFGQPYFRIVRTAGGLFIALAALAQENPFRNNKVAIQEGHALYDRTCTGCHGMNGTVGARGPALAGGRNYYRTTDQALYDT